MGWKSGLPPSPLFNVEPLVDQSAHSIPSLIAWVSPGSQEATEPEGNYASTLKRGGGVGSGQSNGTCDAQLVAQNFRNFFSWSWKESFPESKTGMGVSTINFHDFSTTTIIRQSFWLRPPPSIQPTPPRTPIFAARARPKRNAFSNLSNYCHPPVHPPRPTANPDLRRPALQKRNAFSKTFCKKVSKIKQFYGRSIK